MEKAPKTFLWRTAALYGGIFGVCGLLFFLVNQAAPTPLTTAAPAIVPRPPSHVVPSTLFLLILVIAIGRVLGFALRRIGQPPVVGQVFAGLLLGPSFLGWVWPEASQFLLPAGIASHLGVIAQLGVILYMFQIGLDLNHASLQGRGVNVVAVAHSSIALPFVLGGILGIFLFNDYRGEQASFLSFVLFFGVALAITALPVLARILEAHGMQKTPLGVIALSCAAVDDVTAWCLLSAVVAITQARPQDAIWGLLCALGFVLVALRFVRPWLLRIAGRDLHQGLVAVLIIGVIGSALLTEVMGLHLVFGAFVLGALIPHDSAVARGFDERFRDVVGVVLLPAFFAVTGLNMNVELISGWQDWGLCGLIIALATFGKVLGTSLAARAMGMSWHESSVLGALLNTRGLVELIVLNIGLELGVISPRLFAMLVIMAVVTTLMTAPALRALGYPQLKNN
jgi:Kef-type K+ transport system membrane component KefB